MSRHKLDVYIDASLVGEKIGIGIVMDFDGWECFYKGDISTLESSHSEVAEFIALNRALQRLVGGQTKEFYNTDISVLTDSTVVSDYINDGDVPSSFPDDLMSSCDKLIAKLRKDEYNNSFKLKWISRITNKAHYYAYGAGVKDIKTEKSELYKARDISMKL